MMMMMMMMAWRTDAISSKMDFLPLANVRTDPIMETQCLSDHVHTFYGAQISPRPDVTWDDLRQATSSSGNVEENLSLYWHPTIYKYDPNTGIYTKVDIWFASAYYIWDKDQTDLMAFPPNFQMIADASNAKARAIATCDGRYACERGTGQCGSSNTFLPDDGCGELEMKIVFPVCWNGEVDSDNHMDHVAYSTDPEGSFDGDCPSSHQAGRFPEIQWYFRILNYEGGYHVFANGGGNVEDLHADYMSGWNETFLLDAMLNCEQNTAAAAMPDAWCQDVFTFSDAPKRTGDDNIVGKLEMITNGIPLDTQSTISSESITNVETLPRGACTGTLIDSSTPTPGPTPSPDDSPTPTPTPTPSPDDDERSSTSSGDNSTMVLIGIGVGVSVVLLVVVVLGFFVCRTRK